MTTRINIIALEKQMLSLNVMGQITENKLTEYQQDILVGVIATLQEMKDNLESEETMSFLNIGIKDLPKSLYRKIDDNDVYTYMDTNDLSEHLYSVDGVMEQLRELDIPITKDETKVLGKIQAKMNDKNCGYFRIVKM